MKVTVTKPVEQEVTLMVLPPRNVAVSPVVVRRVPTEDIEVELAAMLAEYSDKVAAVKSR